MKDSRMSVMFCVSCDECLHPQNRSRGKRDHCQDCDKAKTRQLKYGIPVEIYEEFIKRNKQECALKSEKCKGKLCLDHKKDTIRGFLCIEHNRMLGQYEYMKEHMNGLQDYLDGKISLPMLLPPAKEYCCITDCRERIVSRQLCSKHYGAIAKKLRQAREEAIKKFNEMG